MCITEDFLDVIDKQNIFQGFSFTWQKKGIEDENTK